MHRRHLEKANPGDNQCWLKPTYPMSFSQIAPSGAEMSWPRKTLVKYEYTKTSWVSFIPNAQGQMCFRFRVLPRPILEYLHICEMSGGWDPCLNKKAIYVSYALYTKPKGHLMLYFWCPYVLTVTITRLGGGLPTHDVTSALKKFQILGHFGSWISRLGMLDL